MYLFTDQQINHQIDCHFVLSPDDYFDKMVICQKRKYHLATRLRNVERSLVIPSSSAADSATPQSGYGIRLCPSPVLSLPRSACISSPCQLCLYSSLCASFCLYRIALCFSPKFLPVFSRVSLWYDLCFVFVFFAWLYDSARLS